MSAVETRMPRPEAVEIAKAFVSELEGTYDQLIIAGSLRRRLAWIGDVEVVAVPKVEIEHVETAELFGTVYSDYEVDRLDGRLNEMLQAGQVEKRLDANGSPRWGPTLKYLTFQGARVDLFTPEAARLGWILLLRTGPAAFSRQLVVPKRDDKGRPGRTRDRRPGLLPIHIVPREGWLCYRTSGERLETPTERSVFELFGLPYQEPWARI